MSRWTLSELGRHADVGLLILRAGVGVLMMTHGWPKLASGPASWEGLGGAMSTFGITFAPTFWGLVAALVEFVGGALLAIGAGTRITAAFLTVQMFVAASAHLARGEGLARPNTPSS